ncbi:MAG: hypothetical protein KatS3mg011_1884 [Acidimicrobiia bacterium]|nr:MAG: hypothetical protein KatS3mg011_1884 [Acidimicrobiia bacterium]
MTVPIGEILRLVTANRPDLESGLVVQGDTDTSVTTHPQTLARVIEELLDNSKRHGEPPTVLTIQPHHDHIDLTVTDQGPGPNLPADRIYELWGDHPDDPTTPGMGTRLGLHLAYRTAQHAGVTLTYQPPPDWNHTLHIPTT